MHRLPSREAFWQGVTGAPDSGENLCEAARRELFEETQFVPIWLEQTEYWYSIPIANRWRHLYRSDISFLTEYVFVAQVIDGEPVIDPHEHDAYLWCTFDEAWELLLWAENKNALKHCRLFLSNKAL